MTNCLQCAKDITHFTDVQEKQVPVCSNPSCPSYGLLQLGTEIMDTLNQQDNE